MTGDWQHFWKPDWDQTRGRLSRWWQRDGFILHIFADRSDRPHDRVNTQAPFYYRAAGLDPLAAYSSPAELADAWTNPQRRAATAAAHLSTIYYGGDAFPMFDAHLGPGGLATFLGAEPAFAPDTVWYAPVIKEPDQHPPLTLDTNHPWFLKQKAVLQAGMETSGGRFLVAMPDLIENVDTLAALRGTQELMMDFIERPDWVRQRVGEINQAYFAAFDALLEVIQDPWGGNAFSAFYIWGPGKTAKVQCDLCAMISARMFADFAIPALAEQCAWLDYSLYHLDGTQAILHLDELLKIEALDAVEWTPQVSMPQGGDPMWYDLYRRVLAAGKNVQAIGVKSDEVIPLLDALGTNGLYIMVNVDSEAEARALEEAVKPYRR